MSRDIWAKDIVDGLPQIHNERESLYTRMVARHETGYGFGWGKGKSTGGVGSNNWGAVTVSCSSSSPKFVHKDSKFNPKTGRVEVYETCFRIYDSPEAGASHLANILLKENVRQALKFGLYPAVAAQYANKYFLGTSSKPTQEERDKQNIQRYYDALIRNKEGILSNTEEKDPFTGSISSGAGIVAGMVLAGIGVGLVVLTTRIKK